MCCEGVGLLDVADRAGRLLDGSGDARVALRAGARRPLHVLAFADLALEFGVDLGRKLVKPTVVPEESERWITVIAVLGRLTPGLSASISGSFQVLILPR